MAAPDLSKKMKPRSRKLLIKLITVSLPVILLLLLEALLRLVSYGDDLGLFIKNPKEGYQQYLIVNPGVGKKYFQKFDYDTPPNDIFLKKKPEGTFRVFVMGSSTVYGFPYGYNLMFSRILHKRIEDAFPDRHIEVVNTAITAINSYTLLDFARQIIHYEPDAILVYAGHNEFYGAFGVGSNESMSKSRALTHLHLWFMDLRFYQLLRNLTNSTIRKMGSGKPDRVHGTLMKRIAATENIPYNSDGYNLATKRYRQNMGDLLKIFSHRQVPVFFSEVVSNVRDIKPLSYLSTGMEDEAWDAYAGAAEAYHQGGYELARELFFRAKDLDGVRFRASEELNRIIRELCSEYRATLVPMLDVFRGGSPHGISGNNLFTEHVHPNIDGSFLVADAFYSEIIKSGILGAEERGFSCSPEYYKTNWGYTVLDSLLAHHRVTNLKNYWPFVPVDANIPDYRTSYRPGSKPDSIAFTAFRDPGQTLDVLRLELAREYEAQGNHYAAYREYEALIRVNPYLAVNYRDAASSLINLGDLPLALKYFKRSLVFEQSFYASYRIGEIYLIKGDYTNAVKSFGEAFSSTEENDEKLKVLGKLYISCVYGNQEADARAIAQKLRDYNAPQYLQIPPKRYTYSQYIPYQTRNQVNTALQLRSEGRMNEAISILEGSLNIYDSHMARRILGEIYLQMGDTREALYHLNRVYSEFSFDPEFISNLIVLHISAGETREAEGLLNELKRIDPDFRSIDGLTKILSRAQRVN